MMPMMPNFERASLLFLIPVLIILLGIVEWFGWQLTLRALKQLGQLERLSALRRLRMQRFALLASSISLLIVAIAGPYVKGVIRKDALHAIFVLDVSRSMGAKDYPEPLADRFSRAKDAMRVALRRYGEGKVALVIFAGEAFPRIPKLRDFETFEWMLMHWVALAQAPREGSELKAGLEMALKVAEHQFRDPDTKKIKAVVVVLSDGTDASVPPLEVLSRYREEGVRIITVGVGTVEGATITLQALSGETKSYFTRLNEALLKEVASFTGGTYVRLVTGKELADALSRHREAFTSMPVEVPVKALYQWPLTAALIFAVCWILSEMRR
jgi:Ca-activated chloride channel family protein